MSEIGRWTPEDSRALNSEDHSASIKAWDKWNAMNQSAVNEGVATELPDVVDGDRIESYTGALNEISRKQDTVSELTELEQARLARGEGALSELRYEKRRLSASQERLERARSWAVRLQEARARGVEIPEKLSTTERIMYHESKLEEYKKERDNVALRVLEFRGADENLDARSVHEALVHLPEVNEMGGVSWESLEDWVRRLQGTPEGDQAQAVLDKVHHPGGALYTADIEYYRDLVEIHEILQPVRERIIARYEEELRDFAEKVSFGESN
jgi:hypothetical protein